MNKSTNEDLNKSIDTLIDELFSEPVKKGENFEVANASKTTADAVVNAAPKAQNDDARGAGRPKQISSVPNVDQDGKRSSEYDAAIAAKQAEEENEEAKKQALAVTQVSKEGHMGEGKKMHDPRLSKSISDEEYAEFEAFKKSQADAKAKAAQEDLRKAEDLKKAELQDLIKSAVNSAVSGIRQENESLKKSLDKSNELIKAIASQPQRSKSVTGIDALEKSMHEGSGKTEFTKSEKLDAAEALVKAGKLPMDAVIELENTNTVFNKSWQAAIEAQLQKSN
jgi:hypothetical protein